MVLQLFSKTNKTYLVLLLICLISLSLRLWLLDKRWINPDEGAHLMDAVFALDGKIPVIDYGSRQPLYTYALAGTFKLFGVNYVSGRLLPLTCSMLVGFLIFLMARTLFDEKVALLSAAIYWMLPLELMNSVVVKTEPLVTLLICLSLYAVILFSRSSKVPWLIVAGTFAAMGFYVRQSALIVPLTVCGFLLFFHKGRVPEIAKSLGFFLLGYVGFLLMVLIFYSRFILIEDLLTSGLTPFEFLVSSAKKLSALFAVSSQPSNNLAFQAPNVFVAKYSLYHRYIRQAFYLHLFLLIGLGFSVMTLCRHLFSRNTSWAKERLTPHLLVYFWLLSLIMAYTSFFYARGFYIDYFREFLPPLVIAFSAWLRHSISAFERDGYVDRFIIIGISLSGIFYFIISNYKPPFRGVQFASLAIALFGFFIMTYLASRKESRPAIGDSIRFASLSLVLGVFLLSTAYSAIRLDLSYHSVWSPKSLKEASAYLKMNTTATDSVISGAVIWELQGLRRPFLDISHPLSFEFEMTAKEQERIQSTIRTRPPKVIILDGYTERTYFRHIPWLMDFLHSRFELVLTTGPAKFPVKIYQLKDSSLNMTLPVSNET